MRERSEQWLGISRCATSKMNCVTSCRIGVQPLELRSTTRCYAWVSRVVPRTPMSLTRLKQTRASKNLCALAGIQSHIGALACTVYDTQNASLTRFKASWMHSSHTPTASEGHNHDTGIPGYSVEESTAHQVRSHKTRDMLNRYVPSSYV